MAAALLALPSGALAAAKPIEVGNVTDPTVGGAVAVTITGTHALVAASGPGQLTSVDISTPSTPHVAGSTSTFSTELKNASNVAILGNFAYVTAKNHNNSTNTLNDDGTGNALTVVDISNPASPVADGALQDTANLFGSYGIAVNQVGGHTYAYVAAQGLLKGQPTTPLTSTGAFTVVDVTDPAHPALVTSIQNNALPGKWAGTNALQHVTSVAISGHYAYVAASYDNRLTVIDISNPASPAIVASLQDNTRLNFDVDVAIQGNYAYVANQGGNGSGGLPGLAVVDISNPLSPRIVGTDVTGWLNTSYRLRVRRNMAYVATFHSDNAVAVDISNPGNPHVADGIYDPTHLPNTTGVDIDPSSRYLVMTSPSSIVTVISLDPNPLGLVLWNGPSKPTTQTSATFSYFTSDTVASFACSLDGGPLTQCGSTTAKYSGLALGTHKFTVQATDAAGNVVSKKYSWSINAPVTNLKPPGLSGSARQGSTLSSTPGSWSGYPVPSLSYQWENCDSAGARCVPVAGATATSYTLTSADVGRTIRVVVTGNSTSGSKAASSAATAMVVPSVSLSRLRSAFAHQVTAPKGKLAKIRALLKKAGYQLRFTTLEPGVVQISWYYLPAGTRLVISHGVVHAKAGHRGRPKPILVASVRVTFGSAGTRRITIKLTKAGKQLLKSASHLKLIEAGTFTLRGGSPFSKLQPFTLSR